MMDPDPDSPALRQSDSLDRTTGSKHKRPADPPHSDDSVSARRQHVTGSQEASGFSVGVSPAVPRPTRLRPTGIPTDLPIHRPTGLPGLPLPPSPDLSTGSPISMIGSSASIVSPSPIPPSPISIVPQISVSPPISVNPQSLLSPLQAIRSGLLTLSIGNEDDCRKFASFEKILLIISPEFPLNDLPILEEMIALESSKPAELQRFVCGNPEMLSLLRERRATNLLEAQDILDTLKKEITDSDAPTRGLDIQKKDLTQYRG